jgi:sporulation protein YlmC with PRC-barrel domain
MIEAHTTLTNLEQSTRRQDRPWLSVEEKNYTSPKLKSDLSIAAAVDRAIWKDNVLRATDYREIVVQVKNGIVSLTGHVIGAMNRWRVEQALSHVQGILGIKMLLVQDDQLTQEVAASLAWIEQRYREKFFTGVQNGVVVLSGSVRSLQVRDLAEHVAASNPNVRGIFNCIHAPGIDLSSEDPRFFQPVIGEQIIFSDGPSGKVGQVILNPNTRRVVGMILSGRFRSRLGEDGNGQPPSRRVVIPVKVIRYLTHTSGVLSISSTETTQIEDFDPMRYFVPISGWVPPFPYRSEDVLLTADYHEDMAHPENDPDDIGLWGPAAKAAIREGVLI